MCMRLTSVDPCTKAVYAESDDQAIRRKLARYEDICPDPEELRRMRNYYFAHNGGECPCKKRK